MAIDEAIIRRVAQLARIGIDDDAITPLAGELTKVLAMIDELQEVDIAGVEPMSSVMPMNAPCREDMITDGGKAGEILANAPHSREGFFAVPKVME